MNCPRCSAESNLLLEKCLHCGADLFAVPAPEFVGKALASMLIGAMMLWLIAAEKADGFANRREWSPVAILLYLIFGKWPPIVVAWSIAAGFLLREWWERSSSGRLRAVALRQSVKSLDAAAHPNRTVPAAMCVVHRIFVAGIVLLVASVVILRFRRFPSTMPVESNATFNVLAVSVTTLPLHAWSLLLRKYICGQLSSVDCWSETNFRVTVLFLWCLLAVTGLIATICYWPNGDSFSAVMMAFTIVAVWLSGPGELQLANRPRKLPS